MRVSRRMTTGEDIWDGCGRATRRFRLACIAKAHRMSALSCKHLISRDSDSIPQENLSYIGSPMTSNIRVHFSGPRASIV